MEAEGGVAGDSTNDVSRLAASQTLIGAEEYPTASQMQSA